MTSVAGRLASQPKRAWVPAFAGMIGLLLSACATEIPAPLPPAPVAYGPAITIQATPVPLNPSDPSQTAVGNFTYAGGVALTSEQTSRLHGLSDIKVWPDGRILAIGDQADLLEARIVLDHQGHLAGLTDARLTAVPDVDGQPLLPKGQEEFDTEGIAEFPDGGRIVTLEQRDRVFYIPKGRTTPRLAPIPDYPFIHNQGLESVAVDPLGGRDAYVVGDEKTGKTWTCRVSAGCTPGPTAPLIDDFELAGMDILTGGRRAYLLRAFDALRGSRNILRITGPDGAVIDELRIQRPLTVENFEGVAAVASPNGGLRFYLVCDDNFGVYSGKPTGQKTLLLAFDWRPGGT